MLLKPSEKPLMRLELNRRTDYAIRACLRLATAGDGLLSSRRIAAETDVPERFLARVLNAIPLADLLDREYAIDPSSAGALLKERTAS